MAVDIKEIKKCQLKQMQNSFGKPLEKTIIFEEENKLNLPFKQKEEFEKFDNDLSKSSELCKEFVSTSRKTFFSNCHV